MNHLDQSAFDNVFGIDDIDRPQTAVAGSECTNRQPEAGYLLPVVLVTIQLLRQ